MSLVRQVLASIREEDQLEFGSQFASAETRPAIIIGTINIRGHTYGDSTITTAALVSHQGDYTDMPNSSSSRKPRYPHSPDPTEDGKHVDDSESPLPLQPPEDESANDPPKEYIKREHDWFRPGRLFKIWAPDDYEIDRKQFILLDSKNKEGSGLLVRNYDETEARQGYFLRSHVLVRNWSSKKADQQGPSSRKQRVYLDEYESLQVSDGVWIELEHQYNIPFVKYPCVDCGVLEPQSLHDLRQNYVSWLRHIWNLG